MAELQKKREFIKTQLEAVGIVGNGNAVCSGPECNTYDSITCV